MRSPSKTLKASHIEGMKLRIAFAYLGPKMERVRMLQITNIFKHLKSKTRPALRYFPNASCHKKAFADVATEEYFWVI